MSDIVFGPQEPSEAEIVKRAHEVSNEITSQVAYLKWLDTLGDPDHSNESKRAMAFYAGWRACHSKFTARE